MTSTAVVNNPAKQRPKDATRLILWLVAGFFLCLTLAVGSVFYTYIAVQRQYDLLRSTQCGQDTAIANLGITPGGFQTPQGQALADRIRGFENAAKASANQLQCSETQP